jgi:hypothetical protein
VVVGLRKMIRFLENKSEQSTGSGFQNPGIMYQDFYRIGNEYKLVIKIEDENKTYEYYLIDPIIINDREFISRYYGGDS